MTARRRFQTGDSVVVRSHAEILATLDADGTLGGLPFMAEMVDSCGKPFHIQRRVDRTCVAEHPMRRFAGDDVVILDGPRCDGSGHDGCGHGCRIFWKEAWLRSADDAAAPAGNSVADAASLRARLKSKAGERRYFCQSTELLRATQPFPGKQRPWIVRLLIREIAHGELSLGQVLIMMAAWARMRVWRLRGGNSRLQGPHKRTPTASLALKPGEIVRVRSFEQIAQTLDHKSRNRGLGICLEMSRLCEREAEVRYRVNCLIDEQTGIMRDFTNTVTLHNVRGEKTLGEECLCYGEIGDCPRGEIMYWREIWLERVNRS
jgi:hypothetical protein